MSTVASPAFKAHYSRNLFIGLPEKSITRSTITAPRDMHNMHVVSQLLFFIILGRMVEENKKAIEYLSLVYFSYLSCCTHILHLCRSSWCGMRQLDPRSDPEEATSILLCQHAWQSSIRTYSAILHECLLKHLHSRSDESSQMHPEV